MPLFPEVDRVIYQKNPLARVGIDLRFNSLLEISQPPVEFQKKVRPEFPVYDLESGDRGETFPFHTFVGAEGTWKIQLSPENLGVSTSQYRRWEEFSDRVELVEGEFRDVYSDVEYTRVGLFYIDVLDPSAIDSKTITSWSDLLEPDVVGPWVDVGDKEDVGGHQQTTHLVLDRVEGHEVNLNIEIDESADGNHLVAVVAIELFNRVGEFGGKNVRGTLAELHEYSGAIFQRCITQELHEALQPEPV